MIPDSNNETIKIKLPADFKIKRYGVECRLVTEDDSAFILSLRIDKSLSRFLHSTENNEMKQREWIREYKKRESEGKDYYFIYSINGEAFGVNRIYDINQDKCTGGSWICKPGTATEYVVASSLINRDIMFEFLNLKEDNFEVRKGNDKVKKFHKMMGCIKTGENELETLFRSTPDTYFPKRDKMLNLLNIK